MRYEFWLKTVVCCCCGFLPWSLALGLECLEESGNGNFSENSRGFSGTSAGLGTLKRPHFNQGQFSSRAPTLDKYSTQAGQGGLRVKHVATVISSHNMLPPRTQWLLLNVVSLGMLWDGQMTQQWAEGWTWQKKGTQRGAPWPTLSNQNRPGCTHLEIRC